MHCLLELCNVHSSIPASMNRGLPAEDVDVRKIMGMSRIGNPQEWCCVSSAHAFLKAKDPTLLSTLLVGSRSLEFTLQGYPRRSQTLPSRRNVLGRGVVCSLT